MTDRSGMFDPAPTDAEAVEIRERYAAGGVTHRELAAEFGVSRVIIGCLIRGETYRHVAVNNCGDHFEKPLQTGVETVQVQCNTVKVQVIR